MFIGYVLRVKGIEIDEKKDKAIQEWFTPKSITKVKVFMVWLVFIDDFLKTWIL
jgi:hypothetical protein